MSKISVTGGCISVDSCEIVTGNIVVFIAIDIQILFKEITCVFKRLI